MACATATLRTDGATEDVRALARWLRDGDGLRGRVSLADGQAAPGGAGQDGAAQDAALVVLTSATAPALVRWLFDWLKHCRTARQVSLTVRGADGREVELTCGSTTDAARVLASTRAVLAGR
ncbi:hypothetical protein KCV87_09120 [Actinosynnema pretiosum subsp. pretiosum]|uniref:Uncharacterized protein n=2 Tax=Actinosynnema TaxID=40566 RepID=C6WI79_ACTMD|nr:hypothetical protein [Actinosynnema mirum]ACU36122.1 hypothetical protein Amir_2177 [Actinosynnema mirum DSM 43827]QUF06193.1 hypothetical protein KCV87_09120 [Actinosynnema pretiosum subsp. pretiosum]